MTMNNNSKVVLVTGCAKGGIGYEYCKAFAESNCRVFASDIEKMSNDHFSLDNIETLQLDVSSNNSVESAVGAIVSKHGRIDIVVNNAGIGNSGPLVELPIDMIRKAYEINVLGHLRLIQQVVPYMVDQRKGTIVNVGSVVGTVPTPWAGSYCATKAAIHAISDTLRVELKPFGIDVVLVVPGAIKSNFGRNNAKMLEKYDNEWKIYEGFRNVISERANASQGGKATDASVLARYVANKVLSPRPPKVIRFGHMTGLFSLLSWSPIWVRDLFFSTRFGLNKKI
ncbi:short-chain dehydrogenase ptmH-like [Impatiens glandulifera]|uniref:short-chain dehydrogenase ptmH-like n=1 Tax=Impatiens glandulifera TaxID=253017 RepID=UPI001FB14683|nr:short-chain dehydrogenase ptmH-like [Impatiens glandulifera]